MMIYWVLFWRNLRKSMCHGILAFRHELLGWSVQTERRYVFNIWLSNFHKLSIIVKHVEKDIIVQAVYGHVMRCQKHIIATQEVFSCPWPHQESKRKNVDCRTVLIWVRAEHASKNPNWQFSFTTQIWSILNIKLWRSRKSFISIKWITDISLHVWAQ